MDCPNLSCSVEKCANPESCQTNTPPPIESGLNIAPVADTALINNPTAAIKTHATNFDALYGAYNSLRNLARPLNGLQQSDPIPPGVKIKSIRIDYAIDGLPGSATIPDVVLVGEIAPLIGPALRKLIAEIRSELNMLDNVVTAVQAVVGSAASTTIKTSTITTE